MSDLGFNIWGVVSGVFGILVAMVPAFIILFRLPSTKMPALLAIHKEATNLFNTALQLGLFADEEELKTMRLTMSMADTHVDALRKKVPPAVSFTQNVCNWWDGVTGRIIKLNDDLNEIYVKLAERNSEERKSRLPQSLAPDFDLRSANIRDVVATLALSSTSSLRLEPKRQSSLSSMASERYIACYTYHVGLDQGRRNDLDSTSADHPDEPVAPPAQLQHAMAYPSPTHHTVSDSDFQRVLALALSHPLLHTEMAGEDQRVLKEAVQQAGPRLFGHGYPAATSEDATASTRPASHDTLPEMLARLVRRVYGVHPPGDATADPESLSYREVPCTGDDYETLHRDS
ncbi:hypothetical protein C8Q77DRAFT_1076076 [Trametes polyzona]|nr:hypothetical protein C8Q77DRAFT_1076076 [Trametes polyzona]